MANTNVGSAYVTLLPSMKGFSSAINKELKATKITASVGTSIKKESAANTKLFSNFGKESATSFANSLSSGIQKGTQQVGKVITSGFSQTVNSAKSVAGGIANTFTSSFEKVTRAAEVSAAATAVALGAVSRSAYSGYASYEQLVGGVDTLFKESSPLVQNYAAKAYKTAQEVKTL